MMSGFGIALLFLALFIVLSLFRTIPQATVGVVAVFGKFRRIMREGLNCKMP
jgi:regulator of protease activity HflC (stomatin/prohibitin superfamily)